MKRIQIYLFSIAVACLFCGCGQKGGGQGDATDTIVPDTIIVAEQLEPEPEPEPPFTSPDLKWHELQGHVKQEIYLYNDGGKIVYNFDKEGNFTSCKFKGGKLVVKRNKKGQIVEEKWIYSSVQYYDMNTYKYNADGYICYEESSYDVDSEESEFVLNDKGWPISAKSKEWLCGDDYCGKYTSTYTYADIDDHGNWCKCVIKDKGRHSHGDPISNTAIITRKITYWE